MADELPSNEDMAKMASSMPWWLILVWGILAVIIGISLIVSPLITTFYLIMFMGAYWFVGGIFTLVSLISDRSNMGWKAFLGIISILGGAVIMGYPLYSSVIVLTLLVFLVGFWGLLIGGTKLFEAVRSHDAGAGILGVLSIIFGMILLIYPYAAAFALPLVAGFFALFGGILAVVVSFQVKKVQAAAPAQ